MEYGCLPQTLSSSETQDLKKKKKKKSYNLKIKIYKMLEDS